MRFLLITLTALFLFTSQNLTGQDRKGQFWVDGALGATITDDFSLLNARGGYFFTDRLLVGTGLTSELFYDGEFDGLWQVSPFVRYYFRTSEWRPYAEASGSFLFYGGGGEATAQLALGVEKEVAPGVLANVELTYGINDILSTDLRLGLNFNALLGPGDARLAASSQLRKGNWNYGSQPISIGYLRRNNFDLEGYNLTIEPEFAYFLSDRLMLDLGVNLYYEKAQTDSDIGSNFDYKETNIGFKGGLRGYFSKDKKINLFVQAGMEFDRISINRKQIFDVVINEFELTENQFDAILTLGGTFFVNSHTSLDFGLRTTFDLSNNANRDNSIQPALFAAFRFWSKK